MTRDPDRHVFDVADDPGPDPGAVSHLERAREEIDQDMRLERRQRLHDAVMDERYGARPRSRRG